MRRKPRYAQGGIISTPAGGEDRIPVILSEGCHYTPEQARRLFGTETLDRINAIGGRPVKRSFLKRLRAAIPCLRCGGKGTILTKGRRLGREELTDAEYGEYLALGTHFYEAVTEPCPKCAGVKR